MDVVKVRTCKGSEYIEIQLDWQYEDEKYSSVIAVPLKHFRKADMWFIVRMMLDAVESRSKEKERKWESVEQELPKQDVEVLTLNNKGEIMVGKLTKDGWEFPCFHRKPTHWIPIPELPRFLLGNYPEEVR